MDFGTILDQWEERPRKKKDNFRMDKILDSDIAWSGYEKKEDVPDYRGRPPVSAAKLKIDAEIDLHGMTVREAEKALDDFFRIARERGYRKVMIIHGKGNHSSGKGVLSAWVKRYLEKEPSAGRTGKADRKNGGRGATWVMIKR